MDKKILEKTKDFIDFLEDEMGHLEGFEILLNHPTIKGSKQPYADIKEFNIYYLHKENIALKEK